MMKYFSLDKAIEILEQSLEMLDHWDGKNLGVDKLEELIGGVQWDMKATIDLLKQLQKELT